MSAWKHAPRTRPVAKSGNKRERTRVGVVIAVACASKSYRSDRSNSEVFVSGEEAVAKSLTVCVGGRCSIADARVAIAKAIQRPGWILRPKLAKTNDFCRR